MRHAKAHFLRLSAASLAVETPLTRADATRYELMLAQLAEHRRRLKLVQSIERKAEVKRGFLPEYRPWIEGSLAADTGVQDDVLMSVMVWTIDVGDYAAALPIAAYAVRHGLGLPDQYQRTTACLIAEEFADAALAARAAAQPFDPAVLLEAQRITREQDMPDEVRAKLHKAIGLLLADAADLAGDLGFAREACERAREHLLRAMELHAKVGVKKDIERLDRRKLKTLIPAPTWIGVDPGAPGGDTTVTWPPLSTPNPAAPSPDGAG